MEEKEIVIKEQYQIFGSENSSDYDIMVFIKEMPLLIDDGHKLCKYFNAELSKVYNDKPLNCNLATMKNHTVDTVFKGTYEEVNNALYYTYDNHIQMHPNSVLIPIDRDINLKLIRVYRCILSFFSRTDLRVYIKSALRGDLSIKIPTLKMIDFTKYKKFEHKKESTPDIYKVIAFQYGQIFSLIDGFEKDSYTKSGIIKNYPDLINMLNRNELSENDYITLNRYKERLIKLAEDRISSMKKLHE